MNKTGKRGASKTSIIVIVVAIIVLCMIGIAIYLSYDKTQQNIVINEINNINETKNIDQTIKSKAKYAILEKELKDYLNEYLTKTNELANEYSNTTIDNALSIENISQDGPDFTKTKESIKNLKNKEQEVKSALENMTTEEYINNKANELNLSEKYTNIYTTALNLKEDVNNISDMISKYDEYLSTIENMLNFLTNNKDYWSVSQNKILFTKSDLLTQYNENLNKIETAQSNLQVITN